MDNNICPKGCKWTTADFTSPPECAYQYPNLHMAPLNYRQLKKKRKASALREEALQLDLQLRDDIQEEINTLKIEIRSYQNKLPLICTICNSNSSTDTFSQAYACDHYCCNSCLVSWVVEKGNNSTCPMCRSKLRPAIEIKKLPLFSMIMHLDNYNDS